MAGGDHLYRTGYIRDSHRVICRGCAYDGCRGQPDIDRGRVPALSAVQLPFDHCQQTGKYLTADFFDE